MKYFLLITIFFLASCSKEPELPDESSASEIQSDSKLESLLLQAVQEGNPSQGGNWQEIEKLLKQGADPNQAWTEEQHYKSVLHIAIHNHDHESIRLLLDNGADVLAKCEHGAPAFFWAFNHEPKRPPLPFVTKETIKIFTDYKVDLNYQNEDGQTALMKSIQAFIPTQVEPLLEAGVDVRIQDHKGQDALMIAVKKNNYAKLVPIILAKNPDLTATDIDGNTALLIALECVDYENMERLIEAGASVNIRNKAGQTPLHFAVQVYDLKLVNRLISDNLNPREVDQKGNNAIHYMAKSVSADKYEESARGILEVLKSKGVDPDLKNATGDTPLKVANDRPNPLMAKLLKEYGAKLE